MLQSRRIVHSVGSHFGFWRLKKEEVVQASPNPEKPTNPSLTLTPKILVPQELQHPHPGSVPVHFDFDPLEFRRVKS